MRYAGILGVFILGFASILKAGVDLCVLEQISQAFVDKNLLCEGQNELWSYNLSCDLRLLTFEYWGKKCCDLKISVRKWDSGEWRDAGSDSIGLSENEISLYPAKLHPGFYKLSARTTGLDECCKDYYFIVGSIWKNDLLMHCRSMKVGIEAKDGLRGIKEAILISHYDALIDELSKSSILTSDLLERLSDIIKNQHLFEQGQMPRFAIGLNKIRFKRFQGADFAEFVLYIPSDYSSVKKWPVYVHIDSARWYVDRYGGAGSNGSRATFHSGMIDLWWHSIPSNTDLLYLDLKWKDFLFFKKVMEDQLNIDCDRFYLYGECQNGMPSMAVAVNFPDTWAHCIIGGGNSYRYLIGNANNIPIKYAADHSEDKNRVADCNFCDKLFQYYRSGKFIRMDYETLRRQADLIPKEVIERSPKAIRLTIENMNNPKAYWLTILGREDENFNAYIEAVVKGQKIEVKTRNVDWYSLDIQLSPVDHTKPVEIIYNGVSNITESNKYISVSKKYEDAKLVKNNQLHGPIRDVFTDAYTVLYTQGKDDNDTKRIKDIAMQIAGMGPCISEKECNEDCVKNSNIILVGKVNYSAFINKISALLPVSLQPSKISYEGEELRGDAGVMLIYPNPLNSERYLAIFVAISDTALTKIPDIWKNQVFAENADVAVFKVVSGGKYEMIRAEKFDSTWNWHKHWNVPLAKITNDYAKWQWRQWIAYAIRKQMKADIVIDEEAFEGDERPGSKTITLRDLNRMIRNQWVVNIQLNGKELKSLLMQFVNEKPITTTEIDSRKRAVNPIIEGITYFDNKSVSNNNLRLSDLKEDRYYSVVLPYKLINGSRIGTVFQGYTIIGEGYLLPLLYEYLKGNKDIQVDEELKKMKLTIL